MLELSRNRLLENEIRLYLSTLEGKAAERGVALDAMVSLRTPRDSAVLNYIRSDGTVDEAVGGERASLERPSTARGTSRVRVTSGLVGDGEDDLEQSMRSVEGNLGVFKLETVLDKLKDGLREEEELLLEEIEYLQRCLEDEMDAESANADGGDVVLVPTTNDLRELGTQLRDTLETTERFERLPETGNRALGSMSTSTLDAVPTRPANVPPLDLSTRKPPRPPSSASSRTVSALSQYSAGLSAVSFDDDEQPSPPKTLAESGRGATPPSRHTPSPPVRHTPSPPVSFNRGSSVSREPSPEATDVTPRPPSKSAPRRSSAANLRALVNSHR